MPESEFNDYATHEKIKAWTCEHWFGFSFGIIKKKIVSAKENLLKYEF